MVYLTSGGGGGPLETPGPIPAWFKAEVKRDFHFCNIAINGKQLNLRAIDQNGVLFDFLDLHK